MTDLEMTKLCAQAMGWTISDAGDGRFRVSDGEGAIYGIGPDWITAIWNPLVNDSQAMALVKKLKLLVLPNRANGGWWVSVSEAKDANGNADLNRAIMECVANMQARVMRQQQPQPK